MPPAEGALRLLLVEDSPADLRLLQEALKHEAVGPRPETTVACTLTQAEQALQAGHYDCVLLDLGLPDAEGLDNLRRLRAIQRAQAVVVLTGLDSEEAALRALQGGAQDYLVKGRFGGGELWRTVRRAIERNRVLVELEHSREQQYQRATRDPLTGLPNRLLFEETARRALVLAEREHTRLAIGYLDLDGFKQVNDRHGHAVGDALLHGVGQILQAAIRPNDLAARIGGDEFVLLLAPIQSERIAAAVGERLCEQIRAIRSINGCLVAMSASIGFGFYPEYARTLETLMVCADSAMFAAKRAARGRTGRPGAA